MGPRRLGLSLWSLLLVLVCADAFASEAGREAMRKKMEASMVVTGMLEVNQEGVVEDSTVDRAELLPKVVLDFVQQQIADWTFEPTIVDGKAVAVRSDMTVMVVAEKNESDQYRLRLQAASFSPLGVKEENQITAKDMTPPQFPLYAAQVGVSGTVFLIMKVDTDGKVQDVVAEQVNLHVIDVENQLELYRRVLSKSARRAARDWEFIPPTTGAAAREPYWIVRVPVAFSHTNNPYPKYGEWLAYVPGPREPNPWKKNDEPGDSPEALAAGGVHMVGKGGGLCLLTPLGAGG